MHVLVICGISASGKSTLAEKLEDFGFGKVVTSTTREKRDGEIDGIDYHFMDKVDFQRLIELGEFVDHAAIHGNFYGSKIHDYEEIHRRGHIPILVCDPTGAKNLEKYSESKNDFSFSTVFINLNPSDAAQRFLQRIDKDLSGLQSEEPASIIERHARRMTKVFDPDISVCRDLCHQYVAGRKGVESKLCQLYLKQQTMAIRGEKPECQEHSWVNDYDYDLVIKEGVNKERQQGVISRIIHTVRSQEKPQMKDYSATPNIR